MERTCSVLLHKPVEVVGPEARAAAAALAACGDYCLLGTGQRLALLRGLVDAALAGDVMRDETARKVRRIPTIFCRIQVYNPFCAHALHDAVAGFRAVVQVPLAALAALCNKYIKQAGMLHIRDAIRQYGVVPQVEALADTKLRWPLSRAQAAAIVADVNDAAAYAGALSADEAANLPEEHALLSAPISGRKLAASSSSAAAAVAQRANDHVNLPPSDGDDSTLEEEDEDGAGGRAAGAAAQGAAPPPAAPLGYLSAEDMLHCSLWAAWLEAQRLGQRRALGGDLRGRRYWALGGRGGAWCVFVEWDEGRQWGW